MSKIFLGKAFGDHWQNRFKKWNQQEETAFMSSVKIDVGGKGKERVSVQFRRY